MKKYIINEYHEEYRTNAGESWTSSDLMTAFNNETSVEPIEIARFNSKKTADEYLATLEPAWSEQRTNIGCVLTGTFYGLSEVEVEEYDEEMEVLGEEIKIGAYQA